MNFEITPYLLPYTLSMLISLAVGVFAWRRREVTGGLYFAGLALSEGTWTGGYILELASQGVGAKQFWDDFQTLPSLLVPCCMLMFAMSYTLHPRRDSRWVLGGLSITSFIFTLLLYTNGIHHWMRSDVWVVSGEPFDTLTYDFESGYLLLTLFIYICMGIGVWYLGKEFFVGQSYYRRQILILIAGFTIPFIGGLLIFTADITLYGQRDLTPLTFSIGNLIVAYGLFRYRLFDIMPIARHQIIESMDDMVVVMDKGGRVVDINPALERLLNIRTRDIIGESSARVFDRWGNLVTQFQDLVDTRVEVSVAVEEEEKHFDLRFSAIRDKQDRLKGRVIVIRDVTQQKEVEEELQRLNDELQAANQSLQILSQVKDEFVSNVSHELRTPITSLKINADLILLKPENSKVYVERMERETNRLEHIIEDLLTLSRLDQTRVDFAPQTADLNELVAEYVEDRQALATKKQITLVNEAAPELPLVKMDEGLIGQALGILLTNALNYTPAGGRVSVQTQQREKAGQQWVGFSVRDTGRGIPPNEQEHLFERFFRGTAGRESGEAGTGLGLPIAKEIVDRHSGCIECQSTGISGEGTSFHVWLPVVHEDMLVTF